MSSRIIALITLVVLLLLTASGLAMGIDVQFYETPLPEALNELSLLTGVNIIRPNNLAGSVTAQYKGASLSEILSSILATTDYSFQIVDSLLAIVSARNPKDPAFPVLAETRIYRVRPAQYNQVLEQLAQYKRYLKTNKEKSIITVTALPEDLKLIDQTITRALTNVHQRTITYQFEFTRISAEKARGFGIEVSQENEEQPGAYTIIFPMTEMAANFSEKAVYRSVISTSPYKSAHLSLVMAELPLSPSRLLLELVPLQATADSILTAVSFTTDPAKGRKESFETILDVGVGKSVPFAIVRVGSERVKRSLTGFNRSQTTDYYVCSIKADVAPSLPGGSLRLAGSLDGFDQLFFTPLQRKDVEKQYTTLSLSRSLDGERWRFSLQTGVFPRIQIGLTVSDDESSFIDLGWNALGSLFVINRLYVADPSNPSLNIGLREKNQLFGRLYISAQYLPIQIGKDAVNFDSSFLDYGISYEGERTEIAVTRNYCEQRDWFTELSIGFSLNENLSIQTSLRHTDDGQKTTSIGLTFSF